MSLRLLAGCNESPAEAKRSNAIFAYLQRSLVLQGYMERETGGDSRITAKGENAAKGDEGEGEPAPLSSDFRITATGDFVVDYGEVANGPFPPFRLSCTGDFNQGVFETIQVNGIIHRPAESEVWPIDWFGDQPAPE